MTHQYFKFKTKGIHRTSKYSWEVVRLKNAIYELHTPEHGWIRIVLSSDVQTIALTEDEAFLMLI